MSQAMKIGFGGGCHWCTEAVFQTLRGVGEVEQGFIRSDEPYDEFSEAVIVTYDPDEISLDILMEVHLRTHASTSRHKMRGKYRSAIYIFDEDDHAQIADLLRALQDGFDEKLVTQLLQFQEFKPSDERFQNYFQKDPEKPFCRTYIDPKLKLIREEFGSRMKDF